MKQTAADLPLTLYHVSLFLVVLISVNESASVCASYALFRYDVRRCSGDCVILLGRFRPVTVKRNHVKTKHKP